MFKPIKLEADRSYESLPLNRSSNILSYHTDSEDTFSDKDKTEVYYNEEKKRIVPWLIGIYTSLFLFCEYLQTTDLISSKSHNSLSLYTYVYNMLFIWLTCYSLLNFQDIYFEKPITSTQLIIYNIACHIGGIGFALLGEIKALKNIVITKDFWHHITVADIIAFIIVGGPIVFMMIRETVYACKNRSLHRQFFEITIFSTVYGLILGILIINKADGIHYHVHHAICAGILSIYFLDWYSIGLIVVHALLMGIVVEGVNFYGLNEYYLFLTNNSPKINTVGTFTTFSIFFIFYSAIFFCKFKNSK